MKVETIALVGNIQIFDEKRERSVEEIGCDVYKENEIVYPDLVFALKHKVNYIRPIVKKEKHGLEIVSNPLFLGGFGKNFDNILLNLLINEFKKIFWT